MALIILSNDVFRVKKQKYANAEINEPIVLVKK
jgi:hypothetical protein